MLAKGHNRRPEQEARAVFCTTHWSVVLTAGQHSNPESGSALERLCQIYWLPVYAYIRRRGYDPEDAEDLTQEFFAGLLARNGLERVSPAKGKFRSFLLASVNHLLSDARDRARRQKRGGGKPLLSIDTQAAEEGCSLESIHQWTPETLFDRRWAQALVEAVLGQLEQETAQVGKGAHFGVLKAFLAAGKKGPNYEAAAARLGITPGAARVAVHRLRQRFGQLFREAVAETVDSPEEIEPEMRYLLTVLSS